MIKRISKESLVEIISKKRFHELIVQIINNIIQSKQFEEAKEYHFFAVDLFILEGYFFQLETSIDKRSLPIIDFRINNIFMSNSESELTDNFLDRFNELKKNVDNIKMIDLNN